MEDETKYKNKFKFLGFRSDGLLDGLDIERWRRPRIEMVKYLYTVPRTNLGINRS